MAGNITCANSQAIMVVDNLFPAGFPLQQYSTDQSISMGELTTAETRMGVDGGLAAGYIPSIKSVTISLEPFSKSIDYLETLYQLEDANMKKYNITLVITIPSIGKTFTYTGGVLKVSKPFADNKKVLDPTNWSFDFEKIIITKI